MKLLYIILPFIFVLNDISAQTEGDDPYFNPGGSYCETPDCDDDSSSGGSGNNNLPPGWTQEEIDESYYVQFGENFDFDIIWDDPYYEIDDDDVLCPFMNSLTKYVSPTDRRRTILGVSETVDVYLQGLCPGTTVTWSIINDNPPGPMNTTEAIIERDEGNGAITVFSGWRPGKFTVKAVLSDVIGTPCLQCPIEHSIEFEAIVPNDIYMEVKPDYCNGTVRHYINRPGARTETLVYFRPDYVNFYNLQWREGATDLVNPNTGGTVLGYGGEYWSDETEDEMQVSWRHKATQEWITMHASFTVVEGKGTRLGGYDRIGHFYSCRNEIDPSQNGWINWQIKNYYSLPGGLGNFMCYTNQRSENYGGYNSSFILTKGGASVTTNLFDENNFCDGDPPLVECE